MLTSLVALAQPSTPQPPVTKPETVPLELLGTLR